MEKPQMLHNMDYDFDIWYKTNDPVFSQLNKDSRAADKWLKYIKVEQGRYRDSILKPINNYAEELYPKPQLISIEGNTVRLRQGNHAEFFLLHDHKGFFNLDRPWIRQYYNTSHKMVQPDDCFAGTYLFYAPWFLDVDGISIRYERPEIESPFLIYPIETTSKASPAGLDYREPDFIPFHFKRVGSHMVSDLFGKIKRQSAMFDMVFEASDIIVQRVRKLYEQD